MVIKPIFLFSLPRAGSTLVQRVLSTHPSVQTTAEPWILLPLLGAHSQDVLLSQYNHQLCEKAMKAFISNPKVGMDTQLRAFRNYGMTYYQSFSCHQTSYFLDKTPRYHFAASDIAKAFSGEASYILLWRNPLAVLASIVETFGKGRWNILRWEFDLFAGLEGLLKLKTESPVNFVEIHYEKLVSGNADEWKRLFLGLDLEFKDRYLATINDNKISGFGDPTGQTAYNCLTAASISRWPQTFSTPFRKRYAKKWLNWIGKERLLFMGYSLQSLVEELDSAPLMWANCMIDFPYTLRDSFSSVVELDALYRRIRSRSNAQKPYPWS